MDSCGCDKKTCDPVRERSCSSRRRRGLGHENVGVENSVVESSESSFAAFGGVGGSGNLVLVGVDLWALVSVRGYTKYGMFNGPLSQMDWLACL